MTNPRTVKSLVCVTITATALACVAADARASSPLTKGGTVKAVDLAKQTFTVSDAIRLGYDYQGLPAKGADLSVKYLPHTLFLLDGAPTSPEQALSPGRLLKRAWVKHGGSVELFSADSPLVDRRNATLSMTCVAMAERNGKMDASGFIALRLECRDGKIERLYASPFAGCHPSSYVPEVAVDAGGLKYADGKLEGTLKIASTPPTTLEMNAAIAAAAVRGAFTGTQGGQNLQGVVHGELDYPEAAAAPTVAHFVLAPGWDGGAATAAPVLVAITLKDAAAAELKMTPYNAKARLDVQVEKFGMKFHPTIEGSFTVKVDSDTYKPGVYTIALVGRGCEQMGLAGAVGTGLLGRQYEVTKEGQPAVKGLAEFVVRNARVLMPAAAGKSPTAAHGPAGAAGATQAPAEDNSGGYRGPDRNGVYPGAGPNRLVIAHMWRAVLALDPATGKTAWSIPIKSGTTITPTYKDGYLLLGINGVTMYKLDKDARSPKQLWSGPINGIAQVVMLEGGEQNWKTPAISVLRPTKDGFEVAGTSAPLVGTKELWVSPTVAAGRLFIRQGSLLSVYDLRAGK